MERRLLCVLAHPDDECLGTGGILARYSAEGTGTYLVTATRGEHGWFGDEKDYPGPKALGKVREAELLAAAKVLGLREVNFLDYEDGLLDQADPLEAVSRIAAHIRRIQPQVVVTFAPDGSYGHPDHIAICQLTQAAIVAAADLNQSGLAAEPHRVSKLYYMADTREVFDIYQAVFGDVMMKVDDVERRMNPWPDWAVTTQVNTVAHWRTVWQAVLCHRSQLPAYSRFESVAEESHLTLWGRRAFYRAFSLVNGGRKIERDLFEGLR